MGPIFFSFTHNDCSGAPKVEKSGGYWKMERRHVLHTCTMILLENFQVHGHLCTDLIWL